MTSRNRLKSKLLSGERALGVWVMTGAVPNAEILAHAGYDFVVIDHEHGAGDTHDVFAMLRAVDAADGEAVVRIGWNDQTLLKRVLDAGARSIMVPMVETAEEAAAAAASCLYPPRGRRGYAASAVRASNYGTVPGYAHAAADELLLIVQIETAEAVANAGAIAAVDGVDMVFIGINDLGASIGRLEQLDHPDVLALAAQAEDAIKASGKLMGTVPSPGRDPGVLAGKGFHMVASAADVSLLRDGARAELTQWADAFPRVRPAPSTKKGAGY
ncbi:HpcH/HpaI aldolase family protein [Marinivivus vitaminiproducens]|uniref:HpcH/HpaI aldolase family protein n=1 Tax=Marinivivus vitaminiproducens TaxID=3035935 RepID=UPI0027A7DE18|nr:aldolase/citrate lyase family protein [Geminicoccaceae bacterium SCSIO 64248]